MQNQSIPVNYQPTSSDWNTSNDVTHFNSGNQPGPVVNWISILTASALAGLVASIPMGLIMIGLNRVLSTRAEPPKLITKRLANRFGLGKTVRRGKRWDMTTWAAHLGYGAAAASLYPLLTRVLPIPSILRGMVYAMGVWAASYMGWLPAANILPPANRQPARRNVVMILSHLLWGSLIGLLDPRIETAERKILSRQ